MKIKLTTLYTLLITGLVSLNACNNTDSAKTKNWADSAATTVDSALHDVKQDAKMAVAKVENMENSNPDSNFVVKASLDNNSEIRLLQAGIDNGTDKELKAHAKMMIADHKKLGAGVKKYATKKGYILPDNDNGKADGELATLNKKNKGMDWDKEWVGALISGHNEAIDLFENAKGKVKEQELKSMITSALPTLHAHLNMMLQLQDKMGK